MKEAIIIFTRVPVPGKTKTRLEKMLSKIQCAEIHKNFLKDIRDTCKDAKRDIFIYYTPVDQNNVIKSIFGYDVNYKRQEGYDLGEKMHNAIEDVLNKGYNSCILIGTDIPFLNVKDLEKAFNILSENDIVLGPTEDKGYYLVGMKNPTKSVFENIEYGYGNVLDNTIKSIKNANLTYDLTNKNRDIDEPEDLKYFYENIKNGKINRKLNTCNFICRVFEEHEEECLELMV